MRRVILPIGIPIRLGHASRMDDPALKISNCYCVVSGVVVVVVVLSVVVEPLGLVLVLGVVVVVLVVVSVVSGAACSTLIVVGAVSFDFVVDPLREVTTA